MRPPEFWTGQATGRDSAPALQAVLAPVSWAYGAIAAQRGRRAPREMASVPVICAGNLTLGGAGKTPIARALRAKLPGAAVLLRGYRGKSVGAREVDPSDGAVDVGDEALLHARDGLTIISKDRALGARLAEARAARAIILDDGHQNRDLAKDLSIVVIDGPAMFGNGKVFPAGPLREPLKDGLSHADALIVMGPARDALPRFDGPILHAHLAPQAAPPDGPLVAFAGIARPQKFFDTLTAAGSEIVEAAPYPDHHLFDARELDWLAKLANERGAQLITTEKDHVRLPPEWRSRVAILPVIAQFADEAALDGLLAPIRARMSA